MKKDALSLLLTSIFLALPIFFFPFVHGIEVVQIIRDPDFEQGEAWLLRGWYSNYTHVLQNGVVYLNVSDNAGTFWVGCKAQQGSMPHGWSQAPPLQNTITFTGDYKIFLEVKFKLGNWRFLKYPTQSENNLSWINFGVAFWFHRPGTVWSGNDSQMVVGAKIVWLKYNGQTVDKQTQDIYFQGDVGNDLHSLFDVYDENPANHDWVTVHVDMTPCIQKAMKHWNVENPTLMNVEVYLETIGGEGEVWIDRLNVYAALTSEPPHSLLQNELVYALILLIIIFACIIVFKGMMGK